jgi:hypothetical protein
MKNIAIGLLITLSQLVLVAQCPPGDMIMFSSQAQIDEFAINYPNCTDLPGGITITGGGIVNLYGLSNLESIGGDLNFLYTVNLSNFTGLDNLETVGGSILINENYTLTSMSGLNSLTGVQGDFIIFNNVNLLNLGGLTSLISIDGDLNVAANAKVKGIPGMTSLNTIGGSFEISSCPDLAHISGLANLGSIGGDLTISNIDDLADLSGLDQLNTIGGELMITTNENLANVFALSALTSIGGNLTIQSNYALTSLTGLDNIVSGSIANLKIYSNTALASCEVLSICNYLASPGGTIFIENNDTGCNTQQEVEEACVWVGLEEETLAESISVYPNPCISTLKVALPYSPENKIHFSLLNTSGQQLEYNLLKEAQSEIDISNLPSGIYILKVWSDTDVIIQKIIKE